MRVLVVEDEKEIYSFIKKGLEAEYSAVDVATDGEKGLSLARLNKYDALVLDIRLPFKDGLEVCRTLRADKNSVPIIMLTVLDDLKNKVEAFNSGADDYLVKPFAFAELSARLKALKRRGQAAIKAEKLKRKGLELDALTHTLTKNGKPIELSRKEFMLLEYFMRHPGILLTRNMILEHVWDMNADPFSNTVDVHVTLLRKKIDNKGQRSLIQSISGCGYKMV